VSGRPEDDDDALPEDETKKPKKKKQGFAAIPKEKVRELGSEGGKSAHRQGTAHQFTREEAREAGKKGGKKSAATRRKKAGMKE
jgi:general stress protein YciG